MTTPTTADAPHRPPEQRSHLKERIDRFLSLVDGALEEATKSAERSTDEHLEAEGD